MEHKNDIEYFLQMREAVAKLLKINKGENETAENVLQVLLQKMGSVVLITGTHIESEEIQGILYEKENMDALSSLPTVMEMMPEKFLDTNSKLFYAVRNFVDGLFLEVKRAQTEIKEKTKKEEPINTKMDPEAQKLWDAFWNLNKN